MKFISHDGKYEAVYINTYGNETNKGLAVTDRTDPTNMGTYNYCGEYVKDEMMSVSGAMYGILDILPYNTYGNTTPNDKPSSEYSHWNNGTRYGNSDDAENARAEFLTRWDGGGNK